ncbi:MAG TPA: mannose-1-phosphate guanylyltransferase [Chlamydiales bacterium]
MKAIILAGGGGTRLWPLSTEDFPKQFLTFSEGLSLLQKTVQRFSKASFITKVLVSTNSLYEPLVQKQLQAINADCQIVVEPHRRNTGPAIAFALKNLNAAPKESILVLPSDHLIEPESVFLRHVEQIQETLEKQIVLFGIRPTKPETGFGYIRVGEPFDAFTHQARAFVEKPDIETANTFLKSREYYWNAGMFAFTPEVFTQELALYAPAIEQLFHGASYEAMPNISIDYALIEKTKRLVVCPLPVEWSDVGSWDSVYDMLGKDQNHNAIQGNVLAIDTKNSLILGGKKLISTIGLEDLLIVETEEAIFISKKGKSQQVRELVQRLTKKDFNP